MKKKEKTIHQRVQELVGIYEISDSLQSKCIIAIMELIERAKSPEIFCLKCDTRMSIDLDSGNLHCFNCGSRKKIQLNFDSLKNSVNTIAKRRTTVVPNAAPPDPRLLQAINEGEKKTDPTKVKKGNSILKLANNRGGAEISEEDEEHLKRNVPGAKNTKINWC